SDSAPNQYDALKCINALRYSSPCHTGRGQMTGARALRSQDQVGLTRRERQRESTRQRILDAALSLFRERGEGETPLPAVGRTRRELQRESTRQRILDAALSLFRERGYADTSVDQIAERADVARRTL